MSSFHWWFLLVKKNSCALSFIFKFALHWVPQYKSYDSSSFLVLFWFSVVSVLISQFLLWIFCFWSFFQILFYFVKLKYQRSSHFLTMNFVLRTESFALTNHCFLAKVWNSHRRLNKRLTSTISTETRTSLALFMDEECFTELPWTPTWTVPAIKRHQGHPEGQSGGRSQGHLEVASTTLMTISEASTRDSVSELVCCFYLPEE